MFTSYCLLNFSLNFQIRKANMYNYLHSIFSILLIVLSISAFSQEYSETDRNRYDPVGMAEKVQEESNYTTKVFGEPVYFLKTKFISPANISPGQRLNPMPISRGHC